MENNDILVYAQLSRDGKLENIGLELACEALKLSEKLTNSKVCVCLVGANINLDYVRTVFENKGISKIFVVNDKKLKDYSSELYSYCVMNIIEEVNPKIFLVGATSQGRDLAPILAAKLNTGLTADCSELDITEDGKLAATRPTFGGQLMATILSKTYPQMATVRAGVLSRNFKISLQTVEIIEKKYDLNCIVNNTELLHFSPVEMLLDDLSKANVVLAGGAGLKTKAGFDLLKTLAKKLGAAVGSTRKAVEIGLVDETTQIGQTGKTVSPNVYVAFGISGAIQHTIGIMNSKKIIAINNDKNAPIFKIADVGIVADAQEVILEMLKRC